MKLRDPPGGLGEPAVGIEQRALVGGAHKRLVLVLAVDIHQALAQLAQLHEGRGMAVDEPARTAGSFDDAPHEQRAFVAREIVLPQPARDFRTVVDIEFRADLGTLGPAANHDGIGTLAQHRRKGIDQDGFPRPGLAGEHREAAGEFQLELVHDHEIADGQRT